MRLVPRRLLPLLFLAQLPGGPAALPALADSCSGTVVVTDPSGDVDSPWHDVTAITLSEGYGGTWTGRLRVALQLAATDPPDSTDTGIWAVSWRAFGGDSTMTLTVSRCRGAFSGSYTWQSTDGQSSVSGPLDDLIVTPGRMDLYVAREKFGNPPPGSVLTDVGATALITELLPAPLGCTPTLRTDVAGTGTYVLGNCVVAVGPTDARTTAALGPPVPNPARASVQMRLDLPASAGRTEVAGVILDALGRVVRRISAVTEAPRSQVSWDLRDDAGRRVPAGTYWTLIAAPGFTATRRIVVLR